MKLIIAEKPDQGLKLASPFIIKKQRGYIEIEPNTIFKDGAIMTWAVGHLCELIPPEDYDPKWKKWSMDTLPIIPTKFKHRVTKSKWKQFNLIKSLIHRQDVDEIIIAGDAGREGEAIVRIILTLCGSHKPMKRLWISSLTPNSVKAGFQNLLDANKTKPLFDEAMSRACADWLIGMNASRAYTLLLQTKGISDVFSTGRVQTPTLALIVKREYEIENFSSEPFWEVEATFEMSGKVYTGKWHNKNESRIKTEEMAIRISDFCKGKEAIITSIEKNRKEFLPPYLFDLSSLQSTANKMYKFSPQQTLDIAQKLYIKGLISYPRSDSRFVTGEEAQLFPDILKKLSTFNTFKDYFPVPTPSLLKNKRYVNPKRVTDHYAIIPTEQVVDPCRLSGEEQKIYTLIAQRLIAAHDHPAIFDYTTIHTLVDNRATFISKGKEQIQEGWRRVIYSNNERKKSDKEDQDLPSLQKSEHGIVQSLKIKSSKTEPPKRYTEGQLITLMKSCGKHVDDQELSKVLNKTEGLGTEATRAGIIGVLKDRKYIQIKKNQVFATNKGKILIDSVGKSILSSPEMTAKWEQRLHEIGEGKASPIRFMEQVKMLSSKLIEDAITESKAWRFDKYNLNEFKQTRKKKGSSNRIGIKVGKCVLCDGDIIDKGTFYGCSNYHHTQCHFTISKKILGKTLSQTNVKKLLKGEETNEIKGFKKNDNVFSARLKLDSQNKIKFI
ncbi:DNA topoisomerase III [Terrilactibacillus sp. BCM23-1]|uniref:DNA topoisomerase n=1 Tax=Terrilactibacillus tamarindi TaxID=2599694 RepID=A0A6N8CVJ5_9BACI|nr:DNA topoisomerase III [Terrilactibacillus tamarindi]MTT33295.1 DNA topoisomerase III [Terrilactibacillus tamarindi]